MKFLLGDKVYYYHPYFDMNVFCTVIRYDSDGFYVVKDDYGMYFDIEEKLLKKANETSDYRNKK